MVIKNFALTVPLQVESQLQSRLAVEHQDLVLVPLGKETLEGVSRILQTMNQLCVGKSLLTLDNLNSRIIIIISLLTILNSLTSLKVMLMT